MSLRTPGIINSPYLRFPLLVLCGAVFGFALQRGRVHEAFTVVSQMTFSKFIMLKMFLSACATSTLVMYFLEHVANLPTNRSLFADNFSRGTFAVVIGAALLGAGMTFSGSCPGTVFAQLGSGSSNAPYILAGGLFGAFLFALVDNLVSSNTFGFNLFTAGKLKKNTLGRIFGASDKQTPLVLAAMLAGIVLVIEYLVPWQSDLKGLVSNPSWDVAFPPAVSGILIGLIQFPLQYLLGVQLGSSTTYTCVVGNALPFNVSPHMTTCKTRARWQVLIMLGVVLGAYVSSSQSNAVYVSDSRMNPLHQFLGGVLMVFGGQLAGGCTSGHGLSGLGFQSAYSLIAVATMFSVAIGTAFVF